MNLIVLYYDNKINSILEESSKFINITDALLK